VTTWTVVACLTLSTVVVLWPVRRGSRLRAVLPPAGRPAPASPAAASDAAALTRRLPGWWRGAIRAPGVRATFVLPVLTAVAVAGVAAGPVAATVAGVYGVLAVRTAASRHAERARAAHRRELLDHLSAAAADLRAGLPAPVAAAGPTGAGATHRPGDPGRTPPGDAMSSGIERTDGDDPLRQRVRAATALAQRTGAPLAELLDRIEADARAADRAQASAAAQAAGARATAWLLAGLPAGGLALGYAIGADPLAVLLHTPVGAASALGAVGLQVAGLVWTRRIMRAGGALR
jgi:tight adherence protein B